MHLQVSSTEWELGLMEERVNVFWSKRRLLKYIKELEGSRRGLVLDLKDERALNARFAKVISALVDADA